MSRSHNDDRVSLAALLVAVACLLVGFVVAITSGFSSTPAIPNLVPGKIIHQICVTDFHKYEQGKITELPLVQTDAICTYTVLHTWQAERNYK